MGFADAHDRHIHSNSQIYWKPWGIKKPDGTGLWNTTEICSGNRLSNVLPMDKPFKIEQYLYSGPVTGLLAHIQSLLCSSLKSSLCIYLSNGFCCHPRKACNSHGYLQSQTTWSQVNHHVLPILIVYLMSPTTPYPQINCLSNTSSSSLSSNITSPSSLLNNSPLLYLHYSIECDSTVYTKSIP